MTAPAESAGRPPVAFGRACLVSLALITVFAGGPAAAQTCDRSGCGRISCGTPVTPAPQSMWGELQPMDVGPLPAIRDSTVFDEFTQYYSNFPWYTGLEIQNGYLVTSMAYGLKVWDLRTHPTSPDLLGSLDYTKFPIWVDSAEDKWPLQDVAMPPGDDTLAVTACHSGVGLTVVDLADKTKPVVLYQSYRKNGEEVYVATLPDPQTQIPTQYAFLAATTGNSAGGVFVYNLTQARQYRSCAEGFPTSGDPVACPGVYMGKVGSRVSVSYLHGVGNFVVLSSGAGSGFEIWDVANPAQPRLVLTGLNDVPVCSFDLRSVYGVAMWKDANNHYYVGLRTQKYSCTQQRSINEGRIYDVTCNLAGTCNGLGNPIWNQELDSGTSTYFVTFSRSFTTPYLYLGSDDKCRGGSQREYLYDVSDPTSPRDVTPATGYWGWYYRGGATGFNNVMPRRGKFNNDYFYRSMLSFFDIHRHTIGVPPTASFTWPPVEIYPGDPVTFQDTSTAFPTTWTWTFVDSAADTVPPPNP